MAAISVICILVVAPLTGQEDNPCGIKTSLNDSTLVITGTFLQTASTELRNLQYQLAVTRLLSAGSKSTHQQSGSFSAPRDTCVTLSGVQVNVEPGCQIKAGLVVLMEKERLCLAQLDYPGGQADTRTLLTKNPDSPFIIQDAELEISELIIDRTVSKIGQDFYDLFFRNWQTPAGVKHYLIEVEELPSRGRGSRIRIRINDREMTRLNVQPRSDYVEAVAMNAVAMARNYLINYSAIVRQLDGDDKSGTGIY